MNRRLDEALSLPDGERETWLSTLERTEPDLGRELRRLLADLTASAALEQVAQSPLYQEALLAATDADTGIEIGGWQVLRRIGVGGMSEVYLAQRQRNGASQQAALKLMALGLLGADQRRRFAQETAILARLDDARIARLIDAGVTADGRAWLAMDYIDGDNIDRWCDQQRLDIAARVRLLIDVALALDHAHRHLVVHRDLKPGNVLVTHDGQVKLLDFGIAKLLAEDAVDAAAPATATYNRALTPQYASPEQLRGAVTSTASDVYQLGLLLYQLLTGVRAFAADEHDPVARTQAAERSAPRPSLAVAASDGADRAHARRLSPDKLTRALRGDLDSIVQRALDPEPGRRYPGARALADDLQHWLDGAPVQARRGSRGYRLGRYLRRHRLAFAAGLAGLALLLAYAVTVTVQSTRLTAQRNAAVDARQHAEAVQGFLLRLFGSADPRDGEHRGRSADELLEEAVASIDREFAGQPLLAARLLVDIGDVLHRRSRLEPAQRAFQRSLDLRQAQLGAEHADSLISLERLGQVLHHRGDAAAGKRAHQTVLVGRERLFGADSREVVEALILLARDEVTLGDAAAGEALLRRAQHILESRQDSVADDYQEVLSDLGMSLYNQQRYGEAEPLFVRAVDLAQTRYGAHSLDTLTARRNWAATLRQLGRHQQAYDELLAVWAGERTLYDGPHRKLVVTLGHLARTATELGQHEQALDYWQQATTMAIAALGESHLWVAMNRLGHAEAQWAAGRHEQARAELDAVAATAAADPALDARLAKLRATFAAQPSP